MRSDYRFVVVDIAVHALCAFVLAVAVVGCGGGGTGDEAPVPTVSSIAVSTSAVGPLRVGQTMNLSVEARDAQGALLNGLQMIWSSSNNQVATVDASGVVTAVAPGSIGRLNRTNP